MYLAISLLPLFAAVNGAPWEQLASSLTDEKDFQVSSLDDWIEQCVHPFDGTTIPTGPSNWQLFLKPSGLCQAHLECSNEACDGIIPVTPSTFFTSTYNASEFTDEAFKSDDRLNLPDAVVHPKHVGDVSEAIKFAVKHQIGISVKTSGHSYTGSSTKKGTILLNLSRLKKYSPDGSIVECNSGSQIPQGAYQDACTLASARDKPAVVRAGGGEIFNELLAAVSITWNDNEANTKYHIVSGAAATVSAAGGWLASGGLSGNNGMRLYGLGVDQVLHVEMVLPSGVHVRFGPTEWAEDTEKMYPTTKKVTGYCNMGDLSDEALWDWQVCEGDDANIDFHGLWYAVRGGGGGTYGVVTSIYYQLHEYPGELEVLNVNIPGAMAEIGQVDVNLAQQFQMKWIEFMVKFFYDPLSIGVSEFISNSCGTPQGGGFIGGVFLCFNGAADPMKTAWETFYNESADSYISDITTYPSWAHRIVDVAKDDPTVPEGRAVDDPKPELHTNYWVKCPGGTCDELQDYFMLQFLMFPTKAIVENLDDFATTLQECINVGDCAGTMYIMGGKIPLADDGMNSLPLHRRHGGFIMQVNSYEFREKFERIFYNITDSNIDETAIFSGEDNYPGGLCHNHASMDYPTPQKDDWTKACDPRWSEEEKMEKCFSFQETAWGTSILEKLENIHTEIDPLRLFHCLDCVGYADTVTEAPSVTLATENPSVTPATEAPSVTPTTTVSPTLSSGDVPSGGPNTILGIIVTSLTYMLFFGGAW